MPVYPQVPTQSAPMPVRTPLKQRPLVDTAPAMTNIGGAPLRPTPLQAPNLPPPPQAPGFQFTPPTIGAAPTPTAYGSFTPPSLPGGMDPYQFRSDQANKAAQRTAFAKGGGLAGGFQIALAKLNQGLASEEIDNIYRRERDTYALNRDTHQQNYGNELSSYQAGTGAALDAGRLGLAGETAGYDRRYGALRDTYGDQREAALTNTGVINANAQAEDRFRQQMEDYRAFVESQQQADNARVNRATTAATGGFPIRRPMAGSARMHLG